MSRVVEHLAELTAYRDRDLLDVSLAGVLRDLLRPQSVAIFRVVGEGEDARWLTRARLADGQSTASGDPLWTELESLPVLGSSPERHRCLLMQESAEFAHGEGHRCCLPLPGDGGGEGVIELDSAAPLGTEQLRLVSSILRVYSNFQSVLDYSERDTLTGLLNRKTFDDGFLRLAAADVQLAGAAGAPPALPAGGRRPGDARVPLPAAAAAGGGISSTWLGVIDIDHFKRVNDTWGHLIGDEVLLLLSRLMRSSFRFHDQLYRFGGEEFVVLVRCRNAGEAATAMERLRANVERYVFPQVGRITVSVGFSALRPGDTASTAFDRADRAVYWAKEHGRNRVGEFEALVRAGALLDGQERKSDVELF